ncbi:(2Fe-2S)-binding protein [Lysinibacillus sp. BW-2-10]|nr:(2Fe-2S)-binding protein [Lysinibacillus sp. BW-2-10]TSI03151.1 (2Fe-2S)-binding protein [Lysinibacillus sp. BW-2-10]
MTMEKEITFSFNGKQYKGIAGQTIAAALFANGIRAIRKCEVTGEMRGVYCGIGHCYECRATINDVPNIRTCLTCLEDNMIISSESNLTTGEMQDES